MEGGDSGCFLGLTGVCDCAGGACDVGPSVDRSQGAALGTGRYIVPFWKPRGG